MLKLWKSSDILSGIDTFFSTTLNQANVQFHTVLVQAMLHAETHGDATLMGYAIDKARGSTLSAVNVVKWVSKYSPITFGVGSDGKKKVWKLYKQGEAGYVPFNVSDANENPFYRDIETTKINQLYGIDVLYAGINGLLKTAERKLKNNQLADGQNPEAILSLISKIKGVLPTAAVIAGPTGGNTEPSELENMLQEQVVEETTEDVQYA